MPADVINWTPVSSSWVAAVAHDGTSLYVRTKEGRSYRYVGVPRTFYRLLMEAKSKGSYLNEAVLRKYRWEKM